MSDLRGVPPGEPEQPAVTRQLSPAGRCLAVLWLLLFTGWFFTTRLDNNQGIDRLELVSVTPELMIEPFVPTSAAATRPGQAPGPVRAWSHVADRFDMAVCAAAILVGAWGWGTLGLRWLVPGRGLTRLERTVLGIALGLSWLSLATLGCGLAGMLDRRLLGLLVGLGPVVSLLHRLVRVGSMRPDVTAQATCGANSVVLVVVAVPFLLAMILGSLLPSIDFDVNEYHFLGPKEYFQSGQIRFLPHNVYTSFPFATEMLTLLAMVLRDDWYRGAVAGKCVLMAFGPLTSLVLLAAGTRCFGRRPGILAAIAYLTIPWTYRISTTAYAEGGLSFYLAATLAAFVAWQDSCRAAFENQREFPANRGGRLVLLVGFLAGTAMACKYPGLVSVTGPFLAAIVTVSLWPGRSLAPVPSVSAQWPGHPIVFRSLIYAGGVLLAAGPWLLKNLWETGNPVYPLGWTVFGGIDWNAELNARWRAGHSSNDFSPGSLFALLGSVLGKSDWQSPLLFALAPVSILASQSRRRVWGLWLYCLWLFLSCWAFTHRIDRFWVPMLPVAALLAGAGGSSLFEAAGNPDSAPAAQNRRQRLTLLQTALVGWGGLLLCFNLAISVSPLGGNNGFLDSFEVASQLSARLTAPEIVHLNQNLPRGSKVLAVGDAEMFEARFPVVYNTVFDISVFEDWFGEPQGQGDHANRQLRSAEEITRKLTDAGITHVYVNWLEVLRYRSPGNYGYTEFVSPARFAKLQSLGILGPSWQIPEAVRALDQIDDGRLDVIESWGHMPVLERGGTEWLITFQVFPVLTEPVPEPVRP